MVRMGDVSLEAGPVSEFGDEPCVERPVMVQNIFSDLERNYLRYNANQCPQKPPMFGADSSGNFGLIFPANDMYQHWSYFRTEALSFSRVKTESSIVAGNSRLRTSMTVRLL